MILPPMSLSSGQTLRADQKQVNIFFIKKCFKCCSRETVLFRNLCVNLRSCLCGVPCSPPRKILISLTLRKIARFQIRNDTSPIQVSGWKRLQSLFIIHPKTLQGSSRPGPDFGAPRKEAAEDSTAADSWPPDIIDPDFSASATS